MATTQRLQVTPTNAGKFALYDTKRGKCVDLPLWDTRAEAEAGKREYLREIRKLDGLTRFEMFYHNAKA